MDENSGLTPARVLIIDDSRVVRVSLKKVLGSEFNIIEAEDGEAGWEALVADPQIQVVLTDADMPRLNGYELIARIRAHGDTRINSIPVNMVTAADDEAARQRALGLGATDFITKPFDKVQLLARVRAQARMDQTTRDLAETSEALIEHATDDALTGVRSRRYFLRRGEQDLAYTRRHQQDLSIFVIGIDDFDNLKAQHSAATIDRILVSIGTSLSKAVRKEDTLARCGEARFAILAPTLSSAEAGIVCNRIRQLIADDVVSDGDAQIVLSISLGLSQRGIDTAENIEDFLTLAENYLTKAQAAGGNRLLAATSGQEPSQVPKKRISIDAALRILAKGDAEKLSPHINIMVEQLLPLLIFCNEQRQWHIDVQLEVLRQKISH